MNPDQKIEKQFEEFQRVAKENKNVDVAALMISALSSQNKNLVSSRQKRWAYLVSIGLPPFGLLFALKFYLSDQEDASNVANVCVALTIVSVFFVWLMGKLLFSGSGASLDQLQQIKPQDIQQLVQ
ncbi:MAG: hypothetical protein M1383_06450 [Patescibacteria group bacterium]|nr:hypothetical protein [Patescibacteria group bacterium]